MPKRLAKRRPERRCSQRYSGGANRRSARSAVWRTGSVIFLARKNPHAQRDKPSRSQAEHPLCRRRRDRVEQAKHNTARGEVDRLAGLVQPALGVKRNGYPLNDAGMLPVSVSIISA